MMQSRLKCSTSLSYGLLSLLPPPTTPKANCVQLFIKIQFYRKTGTPTRITKPDCIAELFCWVNSQAKEDTAHATAPEEWFAVTHKAIPSYHQDKPWYPLWMWWRHWAEILDWALVSTLARHLGMEVLKSFIRPSSLSLSLLLNWFSKLMG